MILSAIFIGIGLAMDAFAVSVANGISQKCSRFRHAAATALSFGIAQGIMPFIGWLLGNSFASYISAVDHWIAFILLGIIGANMIRETLKGGEECNCAETKFNLRILFFSAIATSIDAFIAGVTFTAYGINSLTDSLLCCGIIAAITAVLCLGGFYIGRFFGNVFKDKAQIFGGAVLIFLGAKTLIEHLFFQ